MSIQNSLFGNPPDIETRWTVLNLGAGVDRSIPWLHRSCVPLEEVDLSTEMDAGQLDMFGNECEGLCGV